MTCFPACKLHCVAQDRAIVITTVHGSVAKLATEKQLERLVKQYDLRRWTFTDTVQIDEKAIPHSHPVLTLHTRHLKQDDELLSMYVHEQLRWYFANHPAETDSA